MKKPFLLISILIVSLMTPVLNSQAEEKIIYWPYFSYPPMFIIEGNELSGNGINIQDYLIRNMPEYTHKRISASPKRMFENLKHGANYCVVGALKTPDRETFMHYSYPCRVSFYPMIVIRSKDKTLDSADKTLSLNQLLGNKDLVFGNIDGIKYGEEINHLIAKNNAEENLNRIEMVSGPDALMQLLTMLVNGRIDYFIAEPTTMQYFIKNEPELEDKITFMQINEQSQVAAAGYVTCPKNEWGKTIINRINKILHQAVTTDEFYSLALPWIKEDFLDEYRKQYNRLLLSNE